MTDSLLDLGNTPILILAVNWGTSPSSEFEITRILNSFAGTAMTIETLNKETPIKFSIMAMMKDKGQEFTYLTFIHSVRGMNLKFWVPYQRQLFKLVENTSQGGTTLQVKDEDFISGYQGYERIYIKMSNGNILTRWVTSATDLSEGIIQLGLSSPLDRDITTTNHVEIGRLLLARFDSDSFEFSCITDSISDIQLTFYELVKEYGEIS